MRLNLVHCLKKCGALRKHKKKVKQSHNTPKKAQGDRIYSSYSFTISALEEAHWSASRPGRALVLGKELPVPIVQEAEWAPKPVLTQRL
jgi:hypothetical protein